jgi:hypothetical protein
MGSQYAAIGGRRHLRAGAGDVHQRRSLLPHVRVARYLTEKLSRALAATLCKEILRWGMFDHHASIGKVDLLGDFASKGPAVPRELAGGDQNARFPDPVRR